MYAFIYIVCVCVCVLYHEPAKAGAINSRPETLMWSCLVYCGPQRLPGGWTKRCWSGASSTPPSPPPDKSILRGNSTSWLPITASRLPTMHLFFFHLPWLLHLFVALPPKVGETPMKSREFLLLFFFRPRTNTSLQPMCFSNRATQSGPQTLNISDESFSKNSRFWPWNEIKYRIPLAAVES